MTQTPWRDASRARKDSLRAHHRGANVVAALRVAERLGSNATVVTLMGDSGLKYMSTELYRAISERSRSEV